MPTNSSDPVLNQNLVYLTNAITALNNSMTMSVGGRPGIFGNSGQGGSANVRPGQGIDRSDPHKDALKAIAAQTLLNKTINSNTDTVKFLIKDQKQNIKDLGKYTAIAGKYFQDSVKDFSIKQLDGELPKRLTSFFEKTFGKDFIAPLKNWEDTLKLSTKAQSENIDAGLRLYNQFVTLDATAGDYISKQHKLLNEITKTGYTFEELGLAARDDGAALKAHAAQVSTGLAEFTAKQKGASEEIGKAGRALKIFGGLILAAGTQQLLATRAAMKYGTEITLATVEQAARAGMSGEELIKIQNENIQSIHSSGMTFDQFNQKLDAGASALVRYTGNLQDGAKITANSLNTFRSLSSHTEDQNGFMDDQAELFKRMNRELGTTSEEFIALNQSLVNSTEVQTSLYKLNSSERVNMVKSLQLQYEKLKLDGLTEEQAKRVVDTFAQLAGKDTKSRFTEAAQLQGVLGTFGFKDTAEFAALHRKGNRRTEAESKRYEQLTRSYNQGINQAYASADYGGQMSIDARLEKIKDTGLFGAGTAGAALATSQGKAQTPEQAAAAAKTDALGNLPESVKSSVDTLIKVQDQVKASGLGIERAMKELFELYVGGKLLGFLSGAKGNLALKAGGTVGELGALGGTASKLGKFSKIAKVGGPLAAIAGIVEGASTGNYEKAAGGAAGGLAGAEFGAAFGTAILPGIGTIVGGLLGGAAGYYGGGAIGNIFHTEDQTSLNDKIAKDEADLADAQKLEKQQHNDKLVDHIKELTEEVKTLKAIQQKHLNETKKTTDAVEQGNAIAAADADANAKKKVVMQKDTIRQPSRL